MLLNWFLKKGQRRFFYSCVFILNFLMIYSDNYCLFYDYKLSRDLQLRFPFFRLLLE